MYRYFFYSWRLKHKCYDITNAHMPATQASLISFSNIMWWLGQISPSRCNFSHFLLLPFICTDANCRKLRGWCSFGLHVLRTPVRSSSIHKLVQNWCSYSLSKWLAGLESNTGKCVGKVIRTHWAQRGTVAAMALLSVKSVQVNTVSSTPCSYRHFTSF